jgi:chromate transporter
MFFCAATTFGGGYALVPVLETSIVEKKQWMREEEFLDALTVAQSIPGVLAANMALILGRRINGLKGSLVACLAAILPSVISVMLIAMIYEHVKDAPLMRGFFSGVQPVVVALLFFSFLKLASRVPRRAYEWTLLLATFVGVAFLGLNPFWAILLGGGLSLWRKDSE